MQYGNAFWAFPSVNRAHTESVASNTNELPWHISLPPKKGENCSSATTEKKSKTKSGTTIGSTSHARPPSRPPLLALTATKPLQKAGKLPLATQPTATKKVLVRVAIRHRQPGFGSGLRPPDASSSRRRNSRMQRMPAAVLLTRSGQSLIAGVKVHDRASSASCRRLRW